MKLRYRLLLSIGLTLLGLVSGIYLLSLRLMLNSFAKLEQRDTTRNVGRANDALMQAITELHQKSSDWSSWDDTYKFMVDKNKAYIHSNMAVVSMKLDAIVYVNPQGKLFFGKPVDRVKGVPPPSPEILRQALKFDRPLSERPGHGGEYSGIVLYKGCPMLVSVRPILNSAGKGPSRGWLIFVLFFDAGELKGLEERTHLSICLHDLNDPRLTVKNRQVIGALSSTKPVLALPLDQASIAGYTLIKDVHDHPIRLLQIIEPRAIYAQGLASITTLTHMILIAGAIFGVVILCVLERFALSRLSRLSNQVENIGEDIAGVCVQLPGGDELSGLASKINLMLGKLERGAQKLRESEERLRLYNENLEQTVQIRTQEIAAKNAVLEHAVEGIAQLDAQGCYLSVNAAYANGMGYSPEELIGQHWTISVPESEQATMYTLFHTMLQEGKAETETQGVRKDGTLFYKEVTIITAVDEAGVTCGNYCFMKNITERKQFEKDIEHQAFHDALTGLPNRVLFRDRIEFALTKARRNQQGTAALFLDLDNFKLVNDSLGHAAGDCLLKAVAVRLQASVRPGDTIARLGGDEFTVLLEDLSSPEIAGEVAQRILESLRSPITLPNSEAFACGTIGIAYTSNAEITSEILMQRADTAMYHAKANGKSNFTFYTDDMNDYVEERMELETALRKALEHSEISAHYQPLIDLRMGKFSGAEALARWQHPTRGMVTPAQFIPIAEETGLIIPIGYWILEEACRQTIAWREEFQIEGFVISVNLSGKQLQRSDVVERVADILTRTGLPPACLKLEITESILMSNAEDVVAKMHRLKALGVKLALDDFGTGYSSLSSLSNFPVDTVKIDREFISRLGAHQEGNNIVAAITMLSRSLSMDVTCEGIELESQVVHIQGLGCETGQGYLFAKPLTASDFSNRLANGGKVEIMEGDMTHQEMIEQLLRELPTLSEKRAA